ncbi:MAG: ShlB/FhaC/HecB family hemolysin secretion/activation protein [Cyanobacteria bacterium J06607_15]
MLTSDNFWHRLNLNYFRIVDLSRLSLPILAIAVTLPGLQPLNAAEKISPENSQTQKLNPSDTTTLLKISLPSATAITSDQLNSPALLAQAQTTTPPPTVNAAADNVPEQIVVKDFEVVGSSIFTEQELNQAVKSYRNRPLTLSELFQARSTITKLYTDKGYVSSGAYIPPQELANGTVQIAVLEGKLEEINVSGTEHLSEDYVASRIETAAGKPINVDSLLGALQLLRLDPLIDNVSAELSAGIRPGTSLLDIKIQEADVFNISTSLNNSRSPSVGTNQRAIGINHGNLFGFGDSFNFEYANTNGSNAIDLAYGVPVNSKNGTIKAAFGTNSNDVIEDPFSAIDIESKSRYYELSLRQPLLLRPTQEFALGMSFTRTESETFLFDESFQLSRGANEDGETRISAVRLFQEFVNRNDKEVLAFRSQFSLGVDALNSTINDDGEPDSTFVSWRGQSQWVRRLREDFLFLLRGDAQFSGGSLVPLEQFRIGGVNSARGYRQDLSLGDNGLFASAELRIPVLRFQRFDGLIQVAPFFDVGTVWNSGDVEVTNATLPAVGVGLNLSLGTNFNARLDWGIPLTSVESEDNSLQEDGIYFSLDSNFF